MHHSHFRSGIVAAVVLGLLTVHSADARKPDRPGGGGGGDDGPTAAELNPAVAFVTTRKNGQQDVVVASADLSSEIVLTGSLQLDAKNAYRLFGSPEWSPSGEFVAFWAQDVVDGVPSKMKLFVSAADGSEVALVRDFSTWDGDGPDYVSDGLNWTPSGAEVLYTASVGLVSIDALTGETFIILSGPAGHPALSPDLDPVSGYQGCLALAAPDGSTEPDGTGVSDIFVVPIEDDAGGFLKPVDVAQIENLTDIPGSSQFHPAWSPDGLQLAHCDDENLAIMDLGTGVVRYLSGGFQTTGSADDRAVWTSDGQFLVYQSPLFGRTDLAIIAADGSGGPINYTATRNRWEASPAWNSQWDPAGPGT